MAIKNIQYKYEKDLPLFNNVYKKINSDNDSDISWQLVNESFYSSYVFYFGGQVIPENFKNITNPSFLKSLISYVEVSMGYKLKQLVSIEAHRQIKGHKVEVHNDYDYKREGYPNIRLIWNLNGRDKLRKGGNFCFNAKNGVISKIFPIIKNTMILFKISKDSFHSINEIISGQRDVIVFSFWTSNKKVSQEEICFYPNLN